MTFLRFSAAALLLLTAGSALSRPEDDKAKQRAADAAVAQFTSPELDRFESDEQFQAYADAVRVASRLRGSWSARTPTIKFAQVQAQPNIQSDANEELCPEGDQQCPAKAEDLGNIVVTGSRVSPSNPSITNNQMRGVEEGDIVKQIDHYLLVLQDGRIFVIDTRADGGRRLALADRINVYRDKDDDIWYDEMLVFGERVLITGYSYGEDATELSVFRLGEDGHLSREGVFYLSSNDYYSSSNYATRLIGDQLVIYTPFDVLDLTRKSVSWPVVRRWHPEGDRDAVPRQESRLFDAASIYRPVRDQFEPTVHTVSVCPLGKIAPGTNLDCRTTAFVGSPAEQWYVTDTDAYLWTGRGWRDSWNNPDCADDLRVDHAQVARGQLYRVPHSGAGVGVVEARGEPIDQFSVLASQGRFRALLRMEPYQCNLHWGEPSQLSYLDVSLDAFGNRVNEVDERRHTSLPETNSRWIANRFNDRYLVYGSMSSYRRGLPEKIPSYYKGDEKALKRYRAATTPAPLYVVPLERPDRPVKLNVGHTVIRAEQAGRNFVLTGYRGSDGLSISVIDVRRRPQVGTSIELPGRFESEGRSHAFNSLIEKDGSGLMGIPTVGKVSDSGRHWWRSRASDLSFLKLNRAGELLSAGELERRMEYADHGEDEDGIPGYECEVSCMDWYGNSRPIFTDGRIFALAGSELIEGRMVGGAIHEVQRLNIAMTPLRRSQLKAR